jgi:hypothetical protein
MHTSHTNTHTVYAYEHTRDTRDTRDTHTRHTHETHTHTYTHSPVYQVYLTTRTRTCIVCMYRVSEKRKTILYVDIDTCVVYCILYTHTIPYHTIPYHTIPYIHTYIHTHRLASSAVRCGAMRCDAMRCDAIVPTVIRHTTTRARAPRTPRTPHTAPHATTHRRIDGRYGRGRRRSIDGRDATRRVVGARSSESRIRRGVCVCVYSVQCTVCVCVYSVCMCI